MIMYSKINICVVIPSDEGLDNIVVGSDEWYNLYPLISNLIKDKLYPGINLDICSTSLDKDDFGNLVFKYKAVPASASTMSSYPNYRALILMNDQFVLFNK